MQPKSFKSPAPRLLPPFCVLAGCSFFFLAGLAFIPKLGVEMDEALFGVVFYEPHGGGYSYHFGHTQLPFMMLPYLGTLKSWLYRPFFHLFGTRIEVLRVPVLVAGAAGIWLFYGLLRRVSNERAAVIGCVLLATDAMYLLTSCFDWGPVALQHLLLIGGALLMVRFWQEGGAWPLAAGCFLFGLALWDKALAAWMLGGLAVAALITIPRQIFAAVSVRRLAIAVPAFALGALPLILYNIHSRGETFRGTAAYDSSDLPGKARVLVATFRGPALVGWMVNDRPPAEPRSAEGLPARASTALAPLAGNPPHGWLWYGFLAALLLAPLARGPDLRAILFALVALTVAWLQMAFTARAGGAVHHTILLWPLPQMIIGISFASASRRLGEAGRVAAALVVVLLAASGMVVINGYYTLVVRNGGAVAWTDAIYPLTGFLDRLRAPTVYCLDWGYLDNVRLLSGNAVPVRVGSEQISKPDLTPEDRTVLLRMISDPENVFVGHARGMEFEAGLSERLVGFAEAQGRRRQMLGVISDSHGRPTFEVYRFLAPAATQLVSPK